MGALLAIILVPYYIGGFISVFVYPWRAGLNVMAYVGAFMHEPSRRNGIPWVIKTLVKMSLWPIVFGVWLRDGKPPARVVFGPDAAERMGRPGDYLPGFQTKWTDPEPWLKPRPVPESAPQGSRAPPRRNEPDLQLIIDFGRHQFLGWEAAGESGAFQDWYGRTAVWHEQLMHGPPGSERAIAQLNQLATTRGGWVAIGAWKLVLEFSTSEVAVEQGAPALDACVQAYEAFGVTNLAIHIPPIEVPAYQRRFGRLPSSDGFFGPPVFSTPDGPQKADFLRAAAQAAASRQPRRLRFAAGVVPERLPAVGTTGLWDYARLVVNGPALVPPDHRDEAAILSATITAVQGTDHRTVVTWMRQTLEADPHAGWAAVGAGRFCEEYLHERLTGSPDHLALVDIGLRFLVELRMLPSNVSMHCLTETERARLRSLA